MNWRKQSIIVVKNQKISLFKNWQGRRKNFTDKKSEKWKFGKIRLINQVKKYAFLHWANNQRLLK